MQHFCREAKAQISLSNRLLFCALLFLNCSAPAQTNPAASIELTDQKGIVSLTPLLQTLMDTSGKLDVEQVAQNPESVFKPLDPAKKQQLVMVPCGCGLTCRVRAVRSTGAWCCRWPAARIRHVAGVADTVARVGDTQFALLIEGPISAEDANDVATKILAAGLRATNELPEQEPLRFNIALGHRSAFSVPVPADGLLR